MKDIIATPSLSREADLLRLSWADGTDSLYPNIWLRDNCPSGFHPDTKERVLDLMALPSAPQIATADIHGDTLAITWQGEDHQSLFPLSWLADHMPGQKRADPAELPAHIWRSDLGAEGIPRFDAKTIADSDESLAAWIATTIRYGLSIVDGLEDRTDAGMDLARRIGFLRQTNFGIEFEVRSKPDPNNLAYTALALPLHTDLPNQELPPGYQFLHCLANEAEGGGSVFADGYAMAEDLRSQDPDAFRLLCETPIPFRFHDGDTDLRVHRPVITMDGDGILREIKWNAHIAGIFDMPPQDVPAYYRSYRAFMEKTRNPAYQVTLKLRGGEMVVFDNRRVLHGRAAFNPATGFRHLQGCYVDRGEVQSRLRVLSRG